ncbi:MAG: protein kinase, partial [Rhodobacteraceae bacterium]|nr:protein kinase [Paracoccaceae bacterium]
MGQEKLATAELPEDSFVDELEPGTKLMNGQYTITRFLNNGGFGITYIAKDSLDRDVVIKECFPNAFCRRSKTLVAARSRAHQAELRSVVKLFVQEARNLSKLIHPNIVGVHQVFEDNGTAYMAIDYIKGRDLLQLIEDKSVALHPDHIVQIAEKMISAIGFVHDNSVLHRDISPDNILLTEEGEPILIDFGAAREQASKKSRALTALRVVKDGYSPQEFYIAGSEQGPWSDLYALGATLFHLISGEAPVNGQSRLSALAEGRPDPYVSLAGRFQGYPEGFLEAIDKAMQALPRNRVQTAHDWLEMFRNPKPKAERQAGEPELVVAKLIASADDVVADEPEESAAVTPTVPEAVEETKAKGKVDPRFAELTVPLDPATEDEAEAETPVVDADDSVPAPAAMPKLAPQRELEPKQAKSRGMLLTATAMAMIVSAGLVAFVYMGAPEDTVDAAPAVATSSAKDTDALPPKAPAPAAEETAATTSKPEVAKPVVTAVETSVVPKARPVTPAAPKETVVAIEPAPVASPEPAAPAAVAPATAAPAVATATVAAEPEPAEPAAPEKANVMANQIAFAVWDIQLPFDENPRMNGDVPVSVITRIHPEVELSASNDWMKPGTTIYSVNGRTLSKGNSAAATALTNLAVDPDGFARSTVQFKEAGSGRFGDGLVASKAIRRVTLTNGTQFEIQVNEGKWETVVLSTADPVAGGLRP